MLPRAVTHLTFIKTREKYSLSAMVQKKHRKNPDAEKRRDFFKMKMYFVRRGHRLGAPL